MSHPDCHGSSGHVCQRPAGRQCVTPGCTNEAGTRWTGHWCPSCDEERLDRISRQFDQIAEELTGSSR